MAKAKEQIIKDAEEAQKKGEPMPSGVSFQAYRTPQFMTIEDAEKHEAGLSNANFSGEVVAPSRPPGPVGDQ